MYDFSIPWLPTCIWALRSKHGEFPTWNPSFSWRVVVHWLHIITYALNKLHFMLVLPTEGNDLPLRTLREILGEICSEPYQEYMWCRTKIHLSRRENLILVIGSILGRMAEIGYQCRSYCFLSNEIRSMRRWGWLWKFKIVRIDKIVKLAWMDFWGLDHGSQISDRLAIIRSDLSRKYRGCIV